MLFNELLGKTVKIVDVSGIMDEGEYAYSLSLEVQNEDGTSTVVDVRCFPIDYGDDAVLSLYKTEKEQ